MREHRAESEPSARLILITDLRAESVASAATTASSTTTAATSTVAASGATTGSAAIRTTGVTAAGAA